MNTLVLQRIFRGPDYTIGKLSLNGQYICDTLEGPDRDLNRDGRLDPPERKIYGKTAIPNGEYPIEFRYSPSFSPRYSHKPMPYLNNIPTHSGVLIHWGNTAEDTKGCILVGRNLRKGMVLHSRKTFDRLWKILWDAKDGLKIKIY